MSENAFPAVAAHMLPHLIEAACGFKMEMRLLTATYGSKCI